MGAGRVPKPDQQHSFLPGVLGHPPWLGHWCPQEEPGSLACGGSGGPPGYGLSTGRPGVGVPLAAVVWGYAGGSESQACSQMTLHPEAPRRLRGARSGPVRPAALCCPPVAAVQGPVPPPTRPQLTEAGRARGRAAGEEAGPGYLGGSHRDLGTHTAAMSRPAPPGTPGQPHVRASPTLRQGPQPTLIAFIPPRGSLAGPAEQQGAGARDRPWGPVSRPQTSPSSR